jgi:hypothetical protein
LIFLFYCIGDRLLFFDCNMFALVILFRRPSLILATNVLHYKQLTKHKFIPSVRWLNYIPIFSIGIIKHLMTLHLFYCLELSKKEAGLVKTVGLIRNIFWAKDFVAYYNYTFNANTSGCMSFHWPCSTTKFPITNSI